MKNYWFLLLLMGGLFVACNEDDMAPEDDHMHHHEEDYDASITIMSPAADAMVTVDEVAHVHVDFTRPDNKILHNIKVEILDAEGNVVKTLVDDHVHEASPYTFHSNEFIPTGHGAYTLRAITTDDAEEHEVKAESSFMAMHGGHGGGGDDYKVTVDIVSPAENVVMAASAAMEVEITFTHETPGEVIHNIRVDVIDASDNVVATLFDDHVHTDQPYTFRKSDALAPDQAGTYRLRAMTTDMTDENMNMMMRAFTVQ
ncbi:MAG: hypothetical protein AAFW73_25630 [Bacteroidota bacterium]